VALRWWVMTFCWKVYRTHKDACNQKDRCEKKEKDFSHAKAPEIDELILLSIMMGMQIILSMVLSGHNVR
jgi:hypothetical protein